MTNLRSRRWCLILPFAAFCGSACAPEGFGDPPAAVDRGPTITLRGFVQKGPFMQGEEVTVNWASADGVFSAEQYIERTGPLGSYASVTHGPSLVRATGNYFDEATGLEADSITLQAYVAVTGAAEQNANVNVFTHLASERVATLMRGGAAMGAAIATAETELFAALAIGSSAVPPEAAGAEMDLTNWYSPGGSYLLALSAIVSSADAPQGLIAAILADFADDGLLTDDTRAALTDAERKVDVRGTLWMLDQYLRAQELTPSLPDLAQYVDTDGDGTVDASDTCRLVANPAQDVPEGALCDVAFSAVEDGGYEERLVVDFDGDGQKDVLSTQTGQVFLSDGAGNLTPTPLSFQMADPLVPIIADGALDYDADGDLDLYELGTLPAGLLLRRQNGTGQFAPPQDIWPYAGGPGGCGSSPPLTWAAFGDWNGDGLPDVVGDSGPCVAIAYGQASGLLGSPVSLLASDNPAGRGKVADFDGDGADDLAIAYEANGRLIFSVWHLAALGAELVTSLDVGAADATIDRGPIAADFDGNGTLDVLLQTVGFDSTTELQQWTVLYGDGQVAFAAAETFAGRNPVALDFDGNGADDVIDSQGVRLGSTTGLSAQQALPRPNALGIGFAFIGGGTPIVGSREPLFAPYARSQPIYGHVLGSGIATLWVL